MAIDRDTTTVVDDRDGIVYVDRYADLVAIPSQCLVDRIVDHFVDKVMQTGRPRRADVHRRPLPDGFKALEHLNVVRVVFATRAITVGPRRGGRLRRDVRLRVARLL